MPTISRTPEPYSSTILSLNSQEQADTGIQSVLLFPATLSQCDSTPAGFQITYISGATGQTHPVTSTPDLPPSLRALAEQILTEYIRQGAVPAPPALSPQAEQARSRSGFLGLGRRHGKGRWV